MTSATTCGPSGSLSVSWRSPGYTRRVTPGSPSKGSVALGGTRRSSEPWNTSVGTVNRRQRRAHAFLRREPERTQPHRHPIGTARVQPHQPPDLRIAGQHVRSPRVLEGERRPDPGDQRGEDVLPARQPVVECGPRQHEQVRRGPTRQHVVGADQAAVRVGEQDHRSTVRLGADGREPDGDVVEIVRPAARHPRGDRQIRRGRADRTRSHRSQRQRAARRCVRSAPSAPPARGPAASVPRYRQPPASGERAATCRRPRRPSSSRSSRWSPGRGSASTHPLG